MSADKVGKETKKKKDEVVTYKLPREAEDFLETIINNYPVHHDKNTLRKVMSLGKVVYSDSKGMTAAVMNTKPYTLIFGKQFMSTKMDRIEDCVWVLSHELTHLVLDHFACDILELFKDKKLGQRAGHIVVDAQVNATVYHSLKDEKYLDIPKKLYSQTEMPDCMLRPDGEPEEEVYKELHRELYSVEGITNEDLIDGLMPWFKKNQDKIDEMKERLVGNHEDLFEDSSRMDDPSDDLSDLTEHMANQMSDWLDDDEEKGKSSGEEEDADSNEEKHNGKKPGKGTNVRKKQVRTCLDKIAYAKRLKKQLNRFYEKSPSARIHEAIEDLNPKYPTRSPVPNFQDRRAAAMFAVGKLPIFYQRIQTGSKVRVPCYVDVSGSQSMVIPYVQPVVSRLKNIIGEYVNCFSNYVNPCRVADFAKGIYESSGGTDFDPVMEDILKNNYTSAVILTDGQAYIRDDLIHRIKSRNIKITVGWTIDAPDVEPLNQVATKTFYLFKGRA